MNLHRLRDGITIPTQTIPSLVVNIQFGLPNTLCHLSGGDIVVLPTPLGSLLGQFAVEVHHGFAEQELAIASCVPCVCSLMNSHSDVCERASWARNNRVCDLPLELTSRQIPVLKLRVLIQRLPLRLRISGP